MKSMISLPRPDRLDALIHLALGLAVVLALGAFFNSMFRVAHRAPEIAQGLEHWSGRSAEALLAVSPTNSHGSERASQRSLRGVPKTRPVGSPAPNARVRRPLDS